MTVIMRMLMTLEMIMTRLMKMMTMIIINKKEANEKSK